MSTPERLRQAARQAMNAQDELLEAWRAWHDDGKPPLSGFDVSLLRKLIYRKIYPINAFEMLASLDIEAAISALLERYLANHVSPDRGFGGFEFDMSSMLDDLVQFGGEAALARLIHHPDFNQEMLRDPRFIASVCEALNIEAGLFPTWLEMNPKVDEPNQG